jgi:hypothetical protein
MNDGPRDELIEALNAERDRDRWAAEAQRLRQRIQNQTDQINGLERSRRRLESLMAGADRRVAVVEEENARLREALEDIADGCGETDLADIGRYAPVVARAALTGKETK